MQNLSQYIDTSLLNSINEISSRCEVNCRYIEEGPSLYFYATLGDIDSVLDLKTIEAKSNKSRFLAPIQEFAIELNPNEEFLAVKSISEYCNNAAFISSLYSEFNQPVPEFVNKGELEFMKEMNAGRLNKNSTSELRYYYERAIVDFFYNQKKIVPKIKALFTPTDDFTEQKGQRVDLDTIIKSGYRFAVIDISESMFKDVESYLKEYYPAIKYNVSDPIIYDLGGMRAEKKYKAIGDTFSHLVTVDELEKSLRENFNRLGIAAVDGMKLDYGKLLRVTVRESDEKIFAEDYDYHLFAGIQNISLSEIENRGDVSVREIPDELVFGFVHFAKSRSIDVYIDKSLSCSERPQIGKIPILYNTYNEKAIQEIYLETLKTRGSYNQEYQKEKPLRSGIAVRGLLNKERGEL